MVSRIGNSVGKIPINQHHSYSSVHPVASALINSAIWTLPFNIHTYTHNSLLVSMELFISRRAESARLTMWWHQQNNRKHCDERGSKCRPTNCTDILQSSLLRSPGGISRCPDVCHDTVLCGCVPAWEEHQGKCGNLIKRRSWKPLFNPLISSLSKTFLCAIVCVFQLLPPHF